VELPAHFAMIGFAGGTRESQPLCCIKGIEQKPIGFLNGLRALKFISIGWRRYPTVIYFQQES
jgi:hypothetical protein